MSTDLLKIKYCRLRRFCIMNKANDSKLTVTKVIISTTFIQRSKKLTISGTEIYVPTPVTENSTLADQLMFKTYVSPSFIPKLQPHSLCSVLNWIIAIAASALLHFSSESSQNIRCAAYWTKDRPGLAKLFSFHLHIHNK